MASRARDSPSPETSDARPPHPRGYSLSIRLFAGDSSGRVRWAGIGVPQATTGTLRERLVSLQEQIISLTTASNLMKILAIEKEIPGVTDDDCRTLLKAEARRAWALYEQGILREMYFRRDHPTAILVLECTSLEEAQSVLGTLPLVRSGLIDFDVIPLAPYPGFGRLFQQETTEDPST